MKLSKSNKELLKAISRELGFCAAGTRAIERAKTISDVWDALDEYNRDVNYQVDNYSNRPPNIKGVLDFIHEESSPKDEVRILAALVQTRFGMADWSLADDIKLQALFENWQEVKA